MIPPEGLEFVRTENTRTIVWYVVGPAGAVHFHCTRNEDSFGERSGGVEFHYREDTKPGYLNDASHHEDCWILRGACWHDGTSVWASDYWIPMYESLGEQAVMEALVRTYYERLVGDDAPTVSRFLAAVRTDAEEAPDE
jgi:hypothetical protein